PPDLERLSHALAALPDPPINQVKSQREYLEILPPGIDKGVALRELAKAIDVPLARIVAFGDNMNDLTMIQTAGGGGRGGGGPAGRASRRGEGDLPAAGAGGGARAH